MVTLYVISVIFGGVIGYSGDDINKFLWMVRIAEGEHPQVSNSVVEQYARYSEVTGSIPAQTQLVQNFQIFRNDIAMHLQNNLPCTEPG